MPNYWQSRLAAIISRWYARTNQPGRTRFVEIEISYVQRRSLSFEEIYLILMLLRSSSILREALEQFIREQRQGGMTAGDK